MPNHVGIAETAKNKIREIIRENTKDPSIEGYQSGPKRVKEIAKAVYQSIHALGIRYTDPPASFDGQKIRFPDQMLNGKQGTCLDLSVFLASCLEDAGLNPVVVFVEGHAYPGCFLHETSFGDAVIKNAFEVESQVSSGSLLLFDSSSSAGEPPVDFEMAQLIAKNNLETFEILVDIKAARSTGILPFNTDLETKIERIKTEVVPKEKKEIENGNTLLMEEKPKTPLDKVLERLLNLSKRNPLLNYLPC